MTFFDKLISWLKYYGIVYFIFLIIIIGLGILYLNKIDFMTMATYVPPETVKDTVQAPDFTKDTLLPPYMRGETMPPVDIMKVGVPSKEHIDKGKGQFTALCSGCHGPEGKGDGPAGILLNPKPRNFTDLNGWKNGPKFSMMYKTVQEGIPGSAMASFNYLPPIDRISIIQYVRTLNPGYPPVTESELAEMDKTYSLSKGFKQPNQMPVSVAIQKTLSEHDTLQAKLANIRMAIDRETKDTAAILFKNIVRDMQKALTVLATDSLWNKGVNQFVNIIESDPVNSGYKTTVYELSQSELNSVYLYLRRLFSS
jgi:mono/diheme cytochrome c family protein